MATNAPATPAEEQNAPPIDEAPQPFDASPDGHGDTAGEPSPLRTPESSALPLPGTVYYPTNLLTRRPQPLEEVVLDKAGGVQVAMTGTIRLRLWISDRGLVTEAIAASSDLPPWVLDQARAAFLRTPFSPGEYYGQRVAVVMTVEIRYEDFVGQ